MFRPCTNFHVEEDMYCRHSWLELVMGERSIVNFTLRLIYGKCGNMEASIDDDDGGADEFLYDFHLSLDGGCDMIYSSVQ